MSQYLLAVYSSDEPREPMTVEEKERGFALVAGLEAEMRAKDALLFSGRLLEAARAKVVRPRRRMGRTTDGPFAETKEQIGGFYILEAPDLGAALARAQKVTDAIDTPIEVRPFMDARRG
ncbi:MAG: YciI family protein [Chloroflexi bacterium]|nr:YciI family protein [Chloroflexota bacterium]